MTELLVVADDLSGAAESAAASLAATDSIGIAWNTHETSQEARVLVIDTDTREGSADRARSIVCEVVGRQSGHAGAERRLVKKIDSLLRGHVAAELAAVRDLGHTIILTPALPALRRTVQHGVIHVDGRPLCASPLGNGYVADGSGSIPEAIEPLEHDLITLDTVRAGTRELAAAIVDVWSTEPSPVVVCDAESDADLDTIAGAADIVAASGRRPVLAGSSALVAAAARLLPVADVGEHRENHAPQTISGDTESRLGAAGTLVVSASRAPVIADQLATWCDRSQVGLVTPTVLLDPARRDRLARQLRERWHAGDLRAVALDPRATSLPQHSTELVRGLATCVAGIAAQVPNLVLLGGHTARSVLDHIGVDGLLVLGQAHYGAVITRTATGQHIVIRPGSFGGTDSLRTIVTALSGGRIPTSKEQR